MLNVELIAFSILGYPVSYLEFLATLFGLASVYLATQENVFTWPSGIVNEWGFFLLFYQVQLYADMFLQVIFFVVTVYGWLHWRSKRQRKKIHCLGWKRFAVLAIFILTTGLLIGVLNGNLHIIAPAVFSEPAASPYWDAQVMVASVVAITLLARKTVEAWVLWIAVDIVSVALFYSREIYLVSIEYIVFLVMACYGYYRWRCQALLLSKTEPVVNV